ncbi:hypothetical protein NDU88_004683 [Pleurodeles waltl]|uniref:Uncharacterized protein n=1 Tax=Pleurodeles waltl TaxID=8319 RepID=A0AAV7NKA3_PLEWA|nr:hypothetical protein NDU88_004683 [Pleurodeles waltl]
MSGRVSPQCPVLRSGSTRRGARNDRAPGEGAGFRPCVNLRWSGGQRSQRSLCSRLGRGDQAGEFVCVRWGLAFGFGSSLGSRSISAPCLSGNAATQPPFMRGPCLSLLGPAAPPAEGPPPRLQTPNCVEQGVPMGSSYPGVGNVPELVARSASCCPGVFSASAFRSARLRALTCLSHSLQCSSSPVPFGYRVTLLSPLQYGTRGLVSESAVPSRSARCFIEVEPVSRCGRHLGTCELQSSFAFLFRTSDRERCYRSGFCSGVP